LTKQFVFGTYLLINANDEDEALYAYEKATKDNLWITSAECFEWNEL